MDVMSFMECPTLEVLDRFCRVELLRLVEELGLEVDVSDRDRVLRDHICVELVNTGRLEEECLDSIEYYEIGRIRVEEIEREFQVKMLEIAREKEDKLLEIRRDIFTSESWKEIDIKSLEKLFGHEVKLLEIRRERDLLRLWEEAHLSGLFDFPESVSVFSQASVVVSEDRYRNEDSSLSDRVGSEFCQSQTKAATSFGSVPEVDSNLAQPAQTSKRADSLRVESFLPTSTEGSQQVIGLDKITATTLMLTSHEKGLSISDPVDTTTDDITATTLMLTSHEKGQSISEPVVTTTAEITVTTERVNTHENRLSSSEPEPVTASDQDLTTCHLDGVMTLSGGHVNGDLHLQLDESTNLLPASVTDEIVTHCLGGEPNTGCPPIITAVFNFSPTKSSNPEAMTSPGGHVDGVLHPEIDESTNLLPASVTNKIVTLCLGGEPNTGCPPMIPAVFDFSPTKSSNLEAMTSPGGHADGVLHPEFEETTNLLSTSVTSVVVTSCLGVEPNSGFPPLITEVIYCSLTDPVKTNNPETVTSAGHATSLNRGCVQASAHPIAFTETGRVLVPSLCDTVFRINIVSKHGYISASSPVKPRLMCESILVWTDNNSVTKFVLRRYKVRLKFFMFTDS
ncbi:uncharacterized protein LOC131928577 [Physella acuta]|uniref:uncharacterized protein LOC131928577 n=1 Tax=Physella acuta TaxID=109671 RepID=UPI0027DB1E9B|nr:uncharacterized protein LOC131928577 [Physella acuta]